MVRELLKWGAPTVPEASDDDAFQMHWLSLPARYLLRDRRPDEAPVTVRFGTIRSGFDLDAAAGSVDVHPCRPDAHVSAEVAGPGRALVGLVQGEVPLAQARRAGITVSGDAGALERVLPEPR